MHKACDDSLRRLQTDHIDVYFLGAVAEQSLYNLAMRTKQSRRRVAHLVRIRRFWKRSGVSDERRS
jgi:aryl-alcohol dehydrogenase-like predicted oxidoreductase